MAVLQLLETVTTVTVTTFPVLAGRRDSLDVPTVNPLLDHIPGTLRIQSMLQTDGIQLRHGKDIGQQLQQILRSTLRTLLAGTVLPGNHIAEETHLAVEVVTLAPADEVIYLRLPSVAVGNIEHARLEVGDDVGTEREILEDAILRSTCKLGILILQYHGKIIRLLAFHQSRRHTEIFDVGFQRFSEFIIVCAIDGNILANLPFRDGAEVDTAQWTIGQHLREIPLSLVDGSGCIPVEADADTLGNALDSYT